MDPQLLDWLSDTRQLAASDLHLSAGLPPMVRRLGQLQALDAAPVCADAMQRLLRSALPDWPPASPDASLSRNADLHRQDHDTAVAVPGLGRFRVNVFAQQRGWFSVWRAIPSSIPALDDIGAPAALRDWVQQPNGLLLVTGATGSGKSTTPSYTAAPYQLHPGLAHTHAGRPDRVRTPKQPQPGASTRRARPQRRF